VSVRELVEQLLRLPQQMPVCRPPEARDDQSAEEFRDAQEISGTSHWRGDYLSADGRSLHRGAFVQIDAEER
jgi:hypothetical protein